MTTFTPFYSRDTAWILWLAILADVQLCQKRGKKTAGACDLQVN
ncbi:hypothetical protein GN947_15590 [Escherichia coli]|nr:hypothetical protein [Escherichia coli]